MRIKLYVLQYFIEIKDVLIKTVNTSINRNNTILISKNCWYLNTDGISCLRENYFLK